MKLYKFLILELLKKNNFFFFSFCQVEITKRLTLEELPPVLILHLKCFIYDKNGGIQKVLKKIDYPIDLDINKGKYLLGVLGGVVITSIW